MTSRILAGLLCCSLFGLIASPILAANSYTVYVGTYTGGDSKGIYAFELNRRTGSTTEPRLVAETPNPSFLALHPTRSFLYAVNEMREFNGEEGGGLSAFKIGDEKLELLNSASTKGGAPCHLYLDRKGRSVIVANYTGGSVISYRLSNDGSVGALGSFVQHTGSSVHPGRQSAPHAHGIYLNRKNSLALVPDLGLDQVVLYRFDPRNAELERNEIPFARVAPGSGPRHLVIHPSEKFVYVLNEMVSTITTFAFDSKSAAMNELRTVSTLPGGYEGRNSTAEIFIHPNGKFLYSSNRGHDSIAIFAIDASNGNLNVIGHEMTRGKTPRSFNLGPTGEWLLAANQNSDTISVFRVNTDSGTLSPTDESLVIPNPVCIVFADGK